MRRMNSPRPRRPDRWCPCRVIGSYVGRTHTVAFGHHRFYGEAPALRIRKSHFPILVVSYSDQSSDLRQAVAVQLEQAKATEYFVLFIVVPAREAIPEFAKELRARVVDRVLRNDLIVLDQQHLAQLIGIGSYKLLLTMVLRL